MKCPNCKVDIDVNYKNYGRDLGRAKYNALVVEIGGVGCRIEELKAKECGNDGGLNEFEAEVLWALRGHYNSLEEKIMRFIFI